MTIIKGLFVYRLGDIQFCADVSSIITTIKVDKLTNTYPGPKLKSFKLLINKLEVPIINLHEIFDITLKKFALESRILLYEKENVRFGFFVDQISEMLTIDRKISKQIEFLPPNDNEYLFSVMKFEGRLLYLPDYQKIARHNLVTH